MAKITKTTFNYTYYGNKFLYLKKQKFLKR